MREAAEARRKRPRCRPSAPVEQGKDAADRPSAPDVFTQLDDMLVGIAPSSYQGLRTFFGITQLFLGFDDTGLFQPSDCLMGC